jgi:pimeloyl-ACP methyl ester carboxylesterase
MSPPRRITIALPEGTMAGWALGPAEQPVDLVVLHATGFNARTYLTLLRQLDPRWSVVALDLRGHGLTELPAEPAQMTHWRIYARDLVAALAQLCPPGVPAPVLMGHSMGASVAVLAAASKPGLARAVLLCDPAMAPPHLAYAAHLPGMQRLMARIIPIARGAARRRADFPSLDAVLASYHGRGAFQSWLPGFLEDYVADGFAETAEGVTLRCRPAWETATFTALRHQPWRALRRLTVPATLMIAETSSTIGYAAAKLHRWAPNARVLSVAGGSHFFPMEQPERVVAVLETMVRDQ